MPASIFVSPSPLARALLGACRDVDSLTLALHARFRDAGKRPPGLGTDAERCADIARATLDRHGIDRLELLTAILADEGLA